jgi:membrane protein required for colicin V production
LVTQTVLHIATLDWAFLAVLLLSLLIGLWRGLVYELISLAAWVVAFVVAQWFAADVARLLPMSGAGEGVRYAAGFILTFVAALFAGGLVALLVKKLVTVVGLAPFDRILGAVFGVVRGVVVLLAFAVVVAMTPLKTAVWWKESVGANALTVALKGLKPVLPAEFGKLLP